MDLTVVTIMVVACVMAVGGNTPAPQRFQANKFLDMLGRTFDPQVAYLDLLQALHERLNLDPISQSNSSATPTATTVTDPNSMAGPSVSCPPATPKQGASITYTSERRVLGSRAFYQCIPGYNGRSQFIQCKSGGQWSSFTGWSGCTPVDCGAPPPSVANSDPSYTTTTFGSVVRYTCQAGYKMDKPNASVACGGNGQWDTPTFMCEKAAAPQMNPAALAAFGSMFGGGGGAAASTNQIQQMRQLQQLASTLLGAEPVAANQIRPSPVGLGGTAPGMFHALLTLRSMLSSPPPPKPTAPLPPPIQLPTSASPSTFSATLERLSNMGYNIPESIQSAAENPMMAAMLKSIQGMQGMPGMQNMPGLANMGQQSAPKPEAQNNAMAAAFANMFPQMAAPAPTTTPKPAIPMLPGGFQLPSHLQSLLPNGITNTRGMRPQDIMTLASAGLGSGTAAGAPRDINSLIGSMDPMSMLGMGLGGAAGAAGGVGGTGAGGAPVDPEKAAEQREEMMMRAMMAGAMKSMMSQNNNNRGNSTGAAQNRNPAMDIMTMMALGNGLAGAGGGGGGGGGAGGMDPMAMMLGGMNPAMLGMSMGGGRGLFGAGGGGGGGGLFGNLFGSAKK